ncbi:MAG: hypothetical protein E7340_02520 [Clostridiales bacterium]|nr:hypothetical protein [Clostridiales bacterium]
MSFYKKILVLKQIEAGFSISDKAVSAMCRIEIEKDVASLHLTTLNVMPIENTVYKFMLVDANGDCFTFDCGKKPTSQSFIFSTMPAVKSGISVGLYAINGVPITFAFASEDNSTCTLSKFKSLVAEKCLEERSLHLQEKPAVQEPPAINTPKKEFPSQKSDTVKAFYDDEAVATTNFYEFDQQLPPPVNIKENDDDTLRIPNVQTIDSREEETKIIRSAADFFKNEADASRGEEYSKEQPYFKTVEQDLEKIFSKYPKDDRLKGLFPKSRWAQINYSADKYYIVGVIKERAKEKYICYGVPAVYSKTPPKELKGFCTFIPLSIFDLSGDGFWMMFQDAVSGECIKPKPPFD